jgi:tetratricopeptide repeat protein 8
MIKDAEKQFISA